MKVLKKIAGLNLHTQILIALLLGIPVGLLLGQRASYLQPVGDIFIRLIRMIVVPLVFSSLLVGTASLGDIRKLGRIGIKTIAYYLCTTAIAITIGLVVANIVSPGKNIDEATKTALLTSYREEAVQRIEIAKKKPSITETLVKVVPSNPIESLAEANMLQIIFFALLLGVSITLLPESKGHPLIEFFDSISEAMIRMVHIVMKIAPLGVLALIAVVVGKFGTEILYSLLKYALAVVAGLAIHMLFVYSSAIKLLAGMSPSTFFSGIKKAQIIAFSTSSSNATLPVTMECAEENLGVPEEISSFVLPLGATINMDGTALYQGAAAVFIAQVYGLDLTLVDQVTIVLMATLASIGAAGVPGIGVITLTMVLETLGLPLEGIALILGVDRILDMLRTTVNITGDASAAVIVSATEKRLKLPELDRLSTQD